MALYFGWTTLNVRKKKKNTKASPIIKGTAVARLVGNKINFLSLGQSCVEIMDAGCFTG